MGDSWMCTWSLELGAGTYNQNPIARGPIEPGPFNNLPRLWHRLILRTGLAGRIGKAHST